MAKFSTLPRPTSLLTPRPCLRPTTTTPACSPAPYNLTTPSSLTHRQTRAATFVPRPRRPYTFTQLIQLSDGSTYTVRSTSPAPLVRSAKDSRNHALWQPSDKSLKNVEVDEAGKLAAFRERFGRGFDLAAVPEDDGTASVSAAGGKADAKDKAPVEEDDAYDLGDLISGYAAAMPQQAAKEPPKKAAPAAKGKGKK
ncbi:54S ribosomal protein L36, mitochondrial [Colletotrichum chlorophyti]|uniref:54S ribosomal protein L36, mitochondrial n=1 Tax=Colletotrichum chlorophyti TaxID=708187 RepID=A0A1Q8RX26_9PEZI|nr:54S ribosomal protein L36, mitochondrial [Colletotrichum chlorophyti]